MNMIERVARAMHETDPYALSWQMQPDQDTSYGPGKLSRMREARAAIEAMREPTPDMVSAGGATTFGGTSDDSFAELAEGMARDAYAAMIDAALTETTHSADHN